MVKSLMAMVVVELWQFLGIEARRVDFEEVVAATVAMRLRVKGNTRWR